MWFLLFVKQFPVIAIAEVKEIIPPPVREPHPHAAAIEMTGLHTDYEPTTPGEHDQ
jgi:molybdopterin-containing oxidoreductase family membrane subunit